MGHADLHGDAGQPAVGLGHQGGQRHGDLGPAGADLLPHRGQLLVPDVEGQADLLGQSPPGLLEQRVALAQHPLELQAQGVVAGPELDHGVVQEPPALPRPALHQHQVVGGEHAHPQRVEQVPPAGPPLSVELGDGPAPGDLTLDEQLAAVALDLAPDHRGGGAGPHEQVTGGAPEGAQGGQEADGLQQGGLARAVGTGDRGQARRQLQLVVAVVAEVRQPEAPEPHPRPPVVR